MEKGFLCNSHRDDDMTVPVYTRNSSSCSNPIGIRKSTAHDAHDGDDDELQRSSKSGVGLFSGTIDGAMGGTMGSTSATKPVAVAVWFGL
jgi:hypothetical protein